MTKTHYFMLLWAICSLDSVRQGIALLTGSGFAESTIPPFVLVIITVIPGIVFYGFLISLGMGFAKKIGIRFLFLETDVDFGKDFFKPAIIVGVAYAGIALIVNAFVPISSVGPFLIPSVFSELVVKFLSYLFHDITSDVLKLLFWFSGAALLVRKIAKNVPMSTIMPAIVMWAALFQFVSVLWHFGVLSIPYKIFIDTLFNSGMIVLLGMLFWKKGLETALLCRIVIATILYLIAPAVVIALSA